MTIRALIVEDEALIALSIQQLLTGAGYDVCGVVATGEDALRVAREKHPEVVVMDILLAGDMNGIEAARKMKAQEDVHVLFTTGYQDEEVQAEAMKLSPLAYMRKPVAQQALLSALKGVRHG